MLFLQKSDREYFNQDANQLHILKPQTVFYKLTESLNVNGEERIR